MFIKYLFKYIDICFLILVLILDYKDIISYIDGSKAFNIFDLIFNLWCLLLIVVIYRHFANKEIKNYVLAALGFSSFKSPEYLDVEIKKTNQPKKCK